MINRAIHDPATESYLCSIVNCVRCGKLHSGVHFAQFRRPPPELNFTHWSLCPETGEPILFRAILRPPPIQEQE